MNFSFYPNQIALYGADQKLLAEVTFPDAGPDTVNLNHTFVDPSLRGQGIAGQLMEAAAAVFTAQHKKVILTCPYAVKWFEQHPEYHSLRA